MINYLEVQNQNQLINVNLTSENNEKHSFKLLLAMFNHPLYSKQDGQCDDLPSSYDGMEFQSLVKAPLYAQKHDYELYLDGHKNIFDQNTPKQSLNDRFRWLKYSLPSPLNHRTAEEVINPEVLANSSYETQRRHGVQESVGFKDNSDTPHSSDATELYSLIQKANNYHSLI